MASALEELRRDPTSRFYGVPQDLTRLIRTFLRPLDGPLHQLTKKRNCRALGLTLDDRLIIQLDDSRQTYVVSLPDLIILQTLSLPPCRKIWVLPNGEFFYQLDDSRFGYQDNTYCFSLTTAGIYLVLASTSTDPGLKFLPHWGAQVDMTPEGKIYFSRQNKVYEYNFLSATPGAARWLFSLPLGSHVMKVGSDKLYFSLTNNLLIYHIESSTLEVTHGFRILYPGYFDVLILDPATNFLYGYWQNENIRPLTSDLARGQRQLVSRSGYLVSWDTDLVILG